MLVSIRKVRQVVVIDIGNIVLFSPVVRFELRGIFYAHRLARVARLTRKGYKITLFHIHTCFYAVFKIHIFYTSISRLPTLYDTMSH